MNNPFDVIEARLSNIESLLLDIKHTPKDHSEKKDTGGIEVATEETGLTSHSIYRLVSERKIPHSKKGGRLYFSRKALRNWIDEGQRVIKK